jgi:hypothetical protein
MVSGVECLPIKYKALNSKAQYDKKKKKFPLYKTSTLKIKFPSHEL